MAAGLPPGRQLDDVDAPATTVGAR